MLEEGEELSALTYPTHLTFQKQWKEWNCMVQLQLVS